MVKCPSIVKDTKIKIISFIFLYMITSIDHKTLNNCNETPTTFVSKAHEILLINFSYDEK